MARQGISVALRDEGGTGRRAGRVVAAAESAACAACGGSETVASGGSDFCAACGAEVAGVELTEAGGPFPAAGSSFPAAGSSAPDASRVHGRWSQDMIRLARASIAAISRQLGLSGVAARAERLFVDSARELLARPGSGHVFARQAAAHRAAACVYAAAREAGHAVGVGEVAAAAQAPTHAVGAAARRVAAQLGLHVAAADAQQRATRAVDRVFGSASAARDDASERRAAVAQLGAAQAFGAALLDFVARHGSLRRAAADAAARAAEFSRLGSRHTGVSPTTLACVAAALGIEHVYASARGALRGGERDAVARVVALLNGAGQHTVRRHAAATRLALVRAAAATPWLDSVRVGAGDVAEHLVDIVACYAAAHACAEGGGAGADALRRVVAGVGAAPAFERARRQRERRAALLAGGGDVSSGEAAALRRLRAQGVGDAALLSLPLATLEDVAPAAARSHAMGAERRRRLDDARVGADDMSDGEVQAYLI